MKKVVPGEQIGICSPGIDLGYGTYIVSKNVYASIAGFLIEDGNRISVSRNLSSPSKTASTVPATNSIVLAKVLFYVIDG
jgi:exosome complex RNA-binding protein Csl4